MDKMKTTCPLCGKEVEFDDDDIITQTPDGRKLTDTEIEELTVDDEVDEVIVCPHCNEKFSVVEYLNNITYRVTEFGIFVMSLYNAGLITDDVFEPDNNRLERGAFELFQTYLQTHGFYRENEYDPVVTPPDDKKPEELFNLALEKMGFVNMKDLSSSSKAHVAWLCFVDGMKRSGYLAGEDENTDKKAVVVEDK